MSDAKIETMVMITGREYEALRAEVERLKSVEADYDDHEREMIDLEDDNARLRARAEELEDLASSYLAAAAQVGGCVDGGCVVLRRTGMRTNGGCRCTHSMDRARERGVSRLLMMAQHIALAAITQEKRDE
jgi:hypothetical protein